MKKFYGLLFLMVLVLSSCGNFNNRDGFETKWVDLPDGDRVLCVTDGGNSIDGVSCDWDNKRGR